MTDPATVAELLSSYEDPQCEYDHITNLLCRFERRRCQAAGDESQPGSYMLPLRTTEARLSAGVETI